MQSLLAITFFLFSNFKLAFFLVIMLKSYESTKRNYFSNGHILHALSASRFKHKATYRSWVQLMVRTASNISQNPELFESFLQHFNLWNRIISHYTLYNFSLLNKEFQKCKRKKARWQSTNKNGSFENILEPLAHINCCYWLWDSVHHA